MVKLFGSDFRNQILNELDCSLLLYNVAVSPGKNQKMATPRKGGGPGVPVATEDIAGVGGPVDMVDTQVGEGVLR